jgi:hypothetical protein
VARSPRTMNYRRRDQKMPAAFMYSQKRGENIAHPAKTPAGYIRLVYHGLFEAIGPAGHFSHKGIDHG